ncbi:MAG: phospholipid carrier-dependent glycosyltransferase [Oscillospiraceae bacterium]|jgi:hypothetical protein|nr:phospholipid carrier-dependent glycosyltransferase [Oscillospiraceae bacterium]
MDAVQTPAGIRRAAPYLAFILLGLVLLLVPPESAFDTTDTQRLTAVAMLTAVLCWVVMCVFGRGRSAGALVTLLIILGVIVRVGYGHYTGYALRQHDLGQWNPSSGEFISGHARYLAHYIENWSPIQEAFWQSHHPPFYYLIGGKIIGFLTGTMGRSLFSALESLQWFGAAVSGMTLVVCRRLFSCLGLRGGPLAAGMALLCFHPSLIILSGSISNENLAVFFMLAAVLLALQWYQKPSWVNTALLALSVGLGILTKLSTVQILPVAAVFIIMKLRGIKSAEGLAPLLRRLSVLLTVCVPLGLWPVLFSWIRFGVSPGFTQPSGAVMYVGDYSFAQRLFGNLPQQLGTLPYTSMRPETDSNIPMHILKSSLFGEFTFGGVNALALVFFCVNLAIIALSAAAFFCAARKRRGVGIAAEKAYSRQRGAAFFLSCIWAVNMLFYIGYNIAMPYIPAMDFRSAIPALVAGAGILALGGDRIKTSNPRLWRALRVPCFTLAAAFAVISCAFFLTID